MSQNRQTFDANLVLKTSATITSDTNGSSVNFGAGRMNGTAWVRVTALDVSSGDERYVINLQGCAVTGFGSGVVNLASMQLGDSSVSLESADSTTGVYEMPFCTEKLGVIYPFVRVSCDVAGTTPSITFSVDASKS